MTDFQIGDTVKNLVRLGNSRSPDYVKADSIGEVISIDDAAFPIGVEFENGVHWFLEPAEIERLTAPSE